MSSFDENEAIQRLPFDQDTFWTNGGLGIDEAAFDALYRRLEKLEALGRIEIVDSGKESYTGSRFFVRVKFRRIE